MRRVSAKRISEGRITAKFFALASPLLFSALFGAVPAYGQSSVLSEEFQGDVTQASERATRNALRGFGAGTGTGTGTRSGALSTASQSETARRLPEPTEDEREALGDAEIGPDVFRIGFGRDFEALDVEALDQGDLLWRGISGGGQIASLEVVSPGAASLRAELQIRELPRGTELRVYSPTAGGADAEFVPLTGGEWERGGTGVLWTPTVAGESLAMQFYLPPGADRSALDFSISTVSHLEWDPKRSDHIGRSRCDNVNASCRSDLASGVVRRAVAKYLFTSSGGRTSTCTGTLLNDHDPATQIPFFITANHCVENQRMASSMEFYWFFERTQCNSPDVRSVRTTGGATVLESDHYTDFSLLRLNAPPPDGVGLVGWTADTVRAGDALAGVYHPAGDLKKVTTSIFRRHGIPSWMSIPGSGRGLTHIRVDQRWATEGGASGSGLFKRVDGQDLLVGTLTGGSQACRNQYDYYGRFDRIYPMIARWLGGDAAGEAIGSPVARIALVDAATGNELADLTPGGVVVDLGYVGARSFNIVAEAHAVEGVRQSLSGPRPASRLSGDGPPYYYLFGEKGGTGLAPGRYAVTAIAYGEDAPNGDQWPAVTASFEVVGASAANVDAIGALALFDHRGSLVAKLESDTDLGTLPGTDGVGAAVEILARTEGETPVGSVRFSVSGANAPAIVHTANHAPFGMPANLPAGTYTISATAFPEANAGGVAGTTYTVERVTLDVSSLSFALVDPRGGAPDPDIGALADGATLDLSATGGSINVRVDVTSGSGVDAVDLELSGPISVTKSESADGSAIALFGNGRGGDYHEGYLPNGDYTLRATARASGQDAGSLEVAFTVTGSPALITGFTAVDPRGGAPDPDIGVLTDGSALDLSATGGSVNVRVDVRGGSDVDAVDFELSGPVSVTRSESADESAFTLFGDGRGGDYHEGYLANGDYTLRATARDSGRDAGSLEIAFTVTGSPSALSSFTAVDARGGIPETDLGALTDGAELDLSATGGKVNVRAETVAGLDVRSVRFTLDGPRSFEAVDSSASPAFTLFGENAGGDYFEGVLPNGTYKLLAQAYADSGARNPLQAPLAVTFSVTGSAPAPDPDDAVTIGDIVLVDARPEATAVDLADVTEGSVLDLTPANGRVNVRAEISHPERVGSVLFDLRGPKVFSRIEGAMPYFLFGGDGDRRPGMGWLPPGNYTLTAKAFAESGAAGAELASKSVSFSVTGSPDLITGFTAVDARGYEPDPDIGALVDGDTLDLSATGGVVNVRANLLDDTGIDSVLLELSGPIPSTRSESADGSPFALFGDWRGVNYRYGYLPNGDYTLRATARAWGRDVESLEIAFTVTGSPTLITGFTAVDPRGGAPDPDIGALADGATLDLSATGGSINVRADVTGGTSVYRVDMELSGPVSFTKVEGSWEGFFALFGGGRGGNYNEGYLPNGDYTLRATAHDWRQNIGSLEIAFTVTGSPVRITGFTAVDPRGGAPDPDIGALADGSALDLSATAGSINVRADVTSGSGVDAVDFELSGPVSVTRSESADGSNFTLFGDGRGGDYHEAYLANGDYTLRATTRASGQDVESLEIAFTVTGSPALITGFTAVDPRGGAPDPDIGALTDGSALDLSATGGSVNFRVDVRDGLGVDGVNLELNGPISVTRGESADGSAFALFGDRRGGDYHEGYLANGDYTLRATARDWGRDVESLEIAFTVTGSPSALSSFMAVDARGGIPETDLGALTDGAELDLSATGGKVNVRVETVAGLDVRSVRFTLDGPRSFEAVDSSASPAFTLFGENAGGDYFEGVLPNGTYKLLAQAYADSGARNPLRAPLAVTFSVTGSAPAPDPDDAVTIGDIVLVDARPEATAVDLADVTEGSVLDLTPANGRVNVRAEISHPERVGSVLFDLRGPKVFSRIEGAMPYFLFGGDGDRRPGMGWLPPGNYTLTAKAFAESGAAGAELASKSVSFSVSARARSASRFVLVDAHGPAPDPDAGEIADLAALDFSRLPNGFNVRFESDWPPAGSVRFTLSGPQHMQGTDRSAPFSLFGEAGGDDYIAGLLPDGAYTLTAAKYEGRDGAGSPMETHSVRFTVTNSTLSIKPVQFSGTTSFTVEEGTAAVGILGASGDLVQADNPVWSISGGADRNRFTLSSLGRLAFEAAKDYENPDDADADGEYALTVTVSGGGLSDNADLTVILTDLNEAPSADAGSDKSGVAGGSAVTLSGSGTDPDAGDSLSYAWTQTGGVEVALSGADTASASFPAPAVYIGEDTELTFILRVTDASGLYAEDEAAVSLLALTRPIFSVTASPALIEEGGSSAITVTIDNGAGFPADQPVALTLGGLSAEDYTLSSADLAAGETSVTVTLAALEDGREEGPETANITVAVGDFAAGGVSVTVEDPWPAPRISGVPQEGNELLAVVPDPAQAVGYRWLRGGEIVAGATGASYVPAGDDVDRTLGVEVNARGRWRAGGAVGPVWPAAGNAPLPAGMEELFSGTVTVESLLLPNATLSGYSALSVDPLEEYGSISNDLFADGVHRLLLGTLAARGRLLLDTAPKIVDVSDIEVHWDGYVVELTERSDVVGPDAWLWIGWASNAGVPFRRYWQGASDGVEVALSIRRPLPAVTVSADATELGEGGVAAFTVALDRPAWSALTVNLDVSETGSTLSGAAPSILEFAAGEDTASLTLATEDDAAYESDSLVTVSLSPGSGYTLGSAASAGASVLNDDVLAVPRASIAASVSSVTEGDVAEYVVSLDPAAPLTLSIALAVSETGSMHSGGAPPTLEFSAGESRKVLRLTTVDDSVVESDSTITVVLALGTGYTVGDGASASVAAVDDDAAAFSVSAADAAITEGQSTTVTVEITNGVTFAQDQTVSLSASGSAMASDYTLFPRELGLSAGAVSASSQLDALEDQLREEEETLSISASREGVSIGSVTVTVTDRNRGARAPEKDIAISLAEGGSQLAGAWTDGEVVWVVTDAGSGEVTSYSVESGWELSVLTLSGAYNVWDIWSDGTTLWAADYVGVRAYRLSDGAREADKDFDTYGDVLGASGVWSDGRLLWVTDFRASTAYAYWRSDKTRAAAHDIALEGAPGVGILPLGFWSDGTTALTMDYTLGKVFALELDSGARRPGQDIDLDAAGVSNPIGFTADGWTLWVVDADSNTLVAFDL